MNLDPLLRVYARIAPSERLTYRLARLGRRFHPRKKNIFRNAWGFTLELDLDVYPDCAMATGLYEAPTARFIRRTLRRGDHFVDGGANIGYLTLIAAQRVGPSGRVDAFEPQPENRARLVENLRRNQLTVHVHDQALSDHAGEAYIHRYDDPQGHLTHGSSSLFADVSVPSHSDVVRTVRLDEVLAGTSPRLIKLDIEGAEPLAIQGMSRLLRVEHPPILIVEHNPTQAKIAGFAADDWLTQLRRIQPRYPAVPLAQQGNVVLYPHS